MPETPDPLDVLRAKYGGGTAEADPLDALRAKYSGPEFKPFEATDVLRQNAEFGGSDLEADLTRSGQMFDAVSAKAGRASPPQSDWLSAEEAQAAGFRTDAQMRESQEMERRYEERRKVREQYIDVLGLDRKDQAAFIEKDDNGQTERAVRGLEQAYKSVEHPLVATLARRLSRGASLGFVDPGRSDPLGGYATDRYMEQDAGTWEKLLATGVEVGASLPAFTLGLKTIGFTPTTVIQGTASAEPGHRLEGAAQSLAFAKGFNTLQPVFTRWFALLPVAEKSAVTQKILSIGADASAGAGASQILSLATTGKLSPEQAFESAFLTGGLRAAHGAGTVGETVGAMRQARGLEGSVLRMKGVPGEAQQGPNEQMALGSGMVERPALPAEASGRAVGGIPLPEEMPVRRPALPPGPTNEPLLTYPPLTAEGLREMASTGRAPQGWTPPEQAGVEYERALYPPQAERPMTAERLREAAAKAADRPTQEPAAPPAVEPRFGAESPYSRSGFPGERARFDQAQPPEAPPNAAGAVEKVGARGKAKPEQEPLDVEADVIDLSNLGGPGKGQRGAVGGPLDPETAGRVDKARAFIKEGARLVGRSLRATGESFTNSGLDDLFRFAPKAAERFSTASTSGEFGKAVGTILGAHVREGVKKAPGEKWAGERFDYAITEEQLRNPEIGDSYRERADTTKHGKRFTQLFPDEASFDKVVRSPEYRDFVERHQDVFDKRVQPMNEKATGKKFEESTRGAYSGVRSNLLPLTDQRVFGGSASAKRAGVKSSTVGKEFKGGAFDYDPRLENQYAHAVRQAQDIVHTKAGLEALARDKTSAMWFDGNPNKPPPPGWQAFDVRKTAGGVRLERSNGEPVAGETLYVRPEIAPDLRTFFEQNRVEEPRGVFSKAGRVITGAQLLSPVDKVFHSLNLAAVNYRLGGFDAFKHYSAFKDPVKRAQAQKRLAELGASKPEYEHGMIRDWLQGKGVELDRIDLAVRTSVLEHTEARIKKGLLPDSLETRRKAVLQAGNYNKRTQDYVVRVLKKWQAQPFAVAARAMTANALRASPLGGFSVGTKASSIGAAAKLRAAVAAKWVAYLAAAGANNFALTGQFMPMGFGKWVAPWKDKDGNWQSWGLPGAMTGFDRMMSVSGVGPAVREMTEGDGDVGTAVGKGVASMASAGLRSTLGGPLTETAATTAGIRLGFGYDNGSFRVQREKAEKAGAGHALRHLNPYVDAILGLFDDEHSMGDTAREAFGPVLPRAQK